MEFLTAPSIWNLGVCLECSSYIKWYTCKCWHRKMKLEKIPMIVNKFAVCFCYLKLIKGTETEGKKAKKYSSLRQQGEKERKKIQHQTESRKTHNCIHTLIIVKCGMARGINIINLIHRIVSRSLFISVHNMKKYQIWKPDQAYHLYKLQYILIKMFIIMMIFLYAVRWQNKWNFS